MSWSLSFYDSHVVSFVKIVFFDLKKKNCAFYLFILQQARELVVKLIRDKDQGEFRVGRADFGSKMGGSSLDVRAFLLIFKCCTAKKM